ncbi:hypothetical protein RB614_21230 [Phytohabitans sp. ZYX-F-186]|uniref:Thioredoxin domain-containing protein n=1 Tax=Phytohabitans maris TaxID=3071409 RepID=A0ABU0ZJ12_9ACTN|nr:hypothetical protein [Phytohabitans sp. ZYX-F-186]MDQ7907038.1 hypothetical protein [Phytohabitans sp. ZYX-F-186]
MSVPTLTVFKGGQPVQSVAGARPKGVFASARLAVRSRCSGGPGGGVSPGGIGS